MFKNNLTNIFLYNKIVVYLRKEYKMKQVKEVKNKDKALEQVLADIERQFGAGAIMKLGRRHCRVKL